MPKYLLLNSIETSYFFSQLRFIIHNQKVTEQREQFLNLNKVFIALVNTIIDKQEKQVFTGFFSKVNFIVQAYGLNTQEEEGLHGMRRFLRRVLIKHKTIPDQGYLLLILKTLNELITNFSGQEIPQELKETYENKILPTFVKPEAPKKTLEYLYGIITKKGEITKNSEYNLSEIELLCDTEDFGSITVIVRDIVQYSQEGEVVFSQKLSQHCQQLIMPYQPIGLTNLEQQGERFISTDNTLLVASPDYLIDATAISRCFSSQARGYKSPYLYLYESLKFFLGNIHTFKGSFVNELLDYYIQTQDKDYESVFKTVFGQLQLDAVTLGLDAGQINHLKQEGRRAFENLKKTLAHYQQRQIITEPSFISRHYGLQGRIDLLIHYPQDNTRKDIIELKNTSFPNYSPTMGGIVARKDHLVQVACYNLLVNDTFYDRKGTSAILYSKDSETPLRNSGKLDREAQEAMWIRNCIVYLEQTLAKTPQKALIALYQKLRQLQLPNYMQVEIDDFLKNYQRASELVRAYFEEFCGLVARELIVAKVGGTSGYEQAQGFAGLWRSSIEEKQGQFNLLSPLRFERIEGDLVYFQRESGEQVTAFREGDIILIYPLEREDLLEPYRHQLLKGNLEQLDGNQIIIKLWHKAVSPDIWERFNIWSLEPNMMESGFKHQLASLGNFLEQSNEAQELLLGQRKPEFDENFSVDYSEHLSEEQNDILNQALSAKDYFLLQGPPGTGKTSAMLRNMVHYLYHETQQVIVLLAFTNRATDEICQKVEDVCGDDFLRLGNVALHHPFRARSLKALNSFNEMQDKVQKTRVFVSTVASFYNYFNLIPRFDTLIVDEASQLLDPSLCGIIPRFKRFILIGDEKQLPAVVTQSPEQCKTQHPKLNDIDIHNLSISLFERLLYNAQQKGWQDCYQMLSTQFRTHQDIAQFFNKEFYHRLKIGSAAQKAPLDLYDAQSENSLERLLAKSRLIFIPQSQEENFKFHLGEAQQVKEILEVVKNAFQRRGEFNAQSVGVITPFRAQIAEIYKVLDANLRPLVSVDTVERYQGSEREVIILSMATNLPAQMHNLQAFNIHQTVDKKLNVALSRAKQQLIILGNEEILETGKYYKKLLHYIANQEWQSLY